MARTKKSDPEYKRGAKFGHEAACEILGKYGRPLAEKNASDLAKNARSRSAVAFDKGYAKAYHAVVWGNRSCKR